MARHKLTVVFTSSKDKAVDTTITNALLTALMTTISRVGLRVDSDSINDARIRKELQNGTEN